jgi:Gpi18-like mannosyltransferase/4-amino-4-deoxy-L-arabinose transferase-like glycosyltransferase
METNMQKDLDKKNSQSIIYPSLRVDFLKRAFQVTKSGTLREGDTMSRIPECCILWFMLLLSIVLRVSLYKIEGSDYSNYVRPWYDYIHAHGGFAALKETFSDYNPAYLYLLALTTYLPIEPIVAIKAISMFFDLVLALFTYLILQLKYSHSYAPMIGAVVILFLPTVFINSAAWGQCDAIYTAWCLGSLYFLLSKRSAWACLCFGIAISFKLQAIFFLPVLIVLFLTRKLPIKSLILIPVIYLALLAPAFLEGRDAWSLLNIYIQQTNAHYGDVTTNAPTFYQWLTAQASQEWRLTGILLATMMVALIGFLTVTSRKPITRDIILKLTFVFSLAIPFFLPQMHERYFYLADVVSLIYAFYFPRSFYVVVIEQLCSLLSYTTYLFGTQVLSLGLIACVVLFLIVITLADLVKTLYPNIHGRAAMLVASSNELSAMVSDSVVSPEVLSNMDSLKVLNDGLSSEVTSDMDCSKDCDTAPPPEGTVAALPSNGHLLLNDALEKEVFHANIERRHTRDLLRQEIKIFLKRPISYVIKKARLKDHRLFLLIVALSTFLRFYRFPSLPMGLNQDEASAGYETFALLLHGTDRWGNRFPVYFPSWGSGQNVLLSYLNIPFIEVFGLTIFGERFSSALLGVLTIVVLYTFVKKRYDTRTALIAAFLLGTNPWHIMMSRWSLESNLLPCFLLLGIASLSYCYTSKHSRILIPFSLFFLALSFYAYGVSIIIIPIFLVLYFLFVGFGTLWRNKLGILLSFVIFFLVASPFLLFILDNYILHTTPSLVQHLPLTVPLLLSSRLGQISGGQNALASNTPFLMSGLVDGLVWNIGGGYLPLGLLSLPLMTIGIYYSIRKREVHANLFLIWLVATIPLFFLFPLNINRANALFLPLIALCAIGMSGLYDSINTKQTKMAVVSLVLAALTVYNSLFCLYYFKNYNNDIKDAFNTGFDVALMQARSSVSANEPMYISDGIGLNYIYTLFFLKADPLDFQKHSRVVLSGEAYQVLSYRNYYFSPDETELTSAPSFVGILKGNEQLSCRHSQMLSSEEGWTVVRCFHEE